jgi:hypothetical protein
MGFAQNRPAKRAGLMTPTGTGHTGRGLLLHRNIVT